MKSVKENSLPKENFPLNNYNFQAKGPCQVILLANAVYSNSPIVKKGVSVFLTRELGNRKNGIF